MVNNLQYRQCTVSVFDNIADPNIQFDEKGICNYYYSFQQLKNDHVKTGNTGKQLLAGIIDTIKKDGKGKPYDCIVGLSGGIDSSYVAYLAHQYGLRPLAVHFDNGWNSELAVMNIQNIASHCNFDLHTLVVDWEEFRDLQLAYIKASVVDIEVPTDHAIYTTLLKLAMQYKIKYMLSGSNINTECIIPKSWTYNKLDHVNLLDIHKKYGTNKLTTYPICSYVLKKRSHMAGIQSINILNYVDYDVHEAKKTIIDKLAWRDYGGKHYESLFTKFYQAYILPEKFGIDKRKAHLSNMIFSGLITKEEALKELELPLYELAMYADEKAFFLKKLQLSETEWDAIMAKAPISHTAFATEQPIDARYKWLKPVKSLYRFIKPLK